MHKLLQLVQSTAHTINVDGKIWPQVHPRMRLCLCGVCILLCIVPTAFEMKITQAHQNIHRDNTKVVLSKILQNNYKNNIRIIFYKKASIS